jgi:AAA domain
MYDYYDLATLHNLPDQEWLINGILPKNGLVVLYGSPGSCKTFVSLDIGLHISNIMDWCGNTICNPGIVVYLLGEGKVGIKKRIMAWHNYNRCSANSSFLVMSLNFNLNDDKEHHTFLQTLSHIESKYNDKISLIVIDTLARSCNGIDENSSKEMSAYIKKLDLIRDKQECCVMLVHHCGKDDTRGMRGSSCILGAADTSIKVSKNGDQVKFTIEKQKEGEPDEIGFNMISYNDSLVIEREQSNTVKQLTIESVNYEEFVVEKDDILLQYIKEYDIYTIAKMYNKNAAYIRYNLLRIFKENNDISLSRDDLIKKYNIKYKNVLPITKYC